MTLTSDRAGEASGCVLCAGADPNQNTALSELLGSGQSRFIAATAGFAAMPTAGCFVRGYLLVVPRTHVLTFGQLEAAELAEAQGLVDGLTARLREVYGMPVLGFEYGLAAAGMRRIEHAHWHLLPTAADLTGWLDQRLPGRAAGSLTDLPGEGSYIAVRGPDAALRVYDVGQDTEEARVIRPRIRLRRAVAELDPRVDDDAWDWAVHEGTELIRETVSDLCTTTGEVSSEAHVIPMPPQAGQGAL